MLLAVIGIVITIMLIGLAVRLLVLLARITVAALGAAIVTGIAMAVLGMDAGREPLTMVSLFLVAFLALLALAWRIGGDGSARGMPARTVADTEPLPATPAARPHDDAADLRRLKEAGRPARWGGARARLQADRARLAIAWDMVAARAIGQRNRVAVARAACERLLAMEIGSLLSSSALDAVAAMVKNVPETVAAYLRVAISGDTGAAAHAFDDMLASLERIAARAEREMNALGQAHAERFAFERAHLDRRSDEDRALL